MTYAEFKQLKQIANRIAATMKTLREDSGYATMFRTPKSDSTQYLTGLENGRGGGAYIMYAPTTGLVWVYAEHGKYGSRDLCLITNEDDYGCYTWADDYPEELKEALNAVLVSFKRKVLSVTAEKLSLNLEMR